jgi:outer membrane lipoprotein SlyB
MTTTNTLAPVFGVMLVLALGACQNTGPTAYPSNQGVARSVDARPLYGVVKSIERVAQENQGIAGSNIGLGTIAGAVVGGVVGHQVGSGTGNTVATVAGAAGGAYVGHELEKRQRTDAYKITVRLEDGSYQALVQDSDPGLRVGDRIRLSNGVLQRY